MKFANSSSVVFLNDFFEKQNIKKIENTRVYVVVDANVKRLHKSKIEKFLNKFVLLGTFEFEACESNKTMEVSMLIIDDMIAAKVDRFDTLIAIGGGMTTDIGGFVSSIYKRGIEWISVPTTLLCMVDAGIGGKCGVNTKSGKNMIGSFYKQLWTHIDTSYLESLAKEDILSGMGEVVKISLVQSKARYEEVQKKVFDIVDNKLEKLSILDSLIKNSIDYKLKIVDEDFRDIKGKRVVLNLGHTMAHAIEKASNNSIAHGIAVLLGLDFSLYISVKYNGLDNDIHDEYRKFIKEIDLLDKLKFSASDIYNYISVDKKIKSNKIDFVVLEGYGKPNVISLDIDTVVKEELVQYFDKLRIKC